jgi:uroporphyrinogen decarboxylase
MTPQQWQTLLDVINGREVKPLPVAFIIDSPWLPGWAGISTLDYFASEQLWLHANLKAVRRFPDVIFLPGFWAEFGMATEPSAFGAKCSWPENDPPFPQKIITDLNEVNSIRKPDPTKDGLLPFALHRLKHCRCRIERSGHQIKFAVSRGPLNIASFLLGTTEFLTAIRTNPHETHKLLEITTDFIIQWLLLQVETFDTIDGIFILDDIVGFCGPNDFENMALPYLKQIFRSFDCALKFLHNDAPGLVCAPHLAELGVNLFNFSFNHSIAEMKKLTNNAVTLLGNIPPRDVLAAGTPRQVRAAVEAMLASLPDSRRLLPSCGGGLPPGVPTKNIEAFLSAVTSASAD